MPGRKLNLLILVAGLGFGGAEVVVKHLVTALDRRRFDVTLCCIKNAGAIGEELIRNGLEVVVLSDSNGRKAEYLTFIKLWRVLRSRRIDVIHSHTTDALADAALCKLLRPSLKLVHTFHFGNYPQASRQKLRIERVFSRLVTNLVAVGEVQRQQIRATFGFADQAIETVWNGVPLESAVSDGSFRRQIGAGDRMIIGTIATLIPQKGLMDLLEVAKRLQAINPSVLFVVLGDGRLRMELEARRDALGLSDMVLLPGWVKDASRVALPEFDVFFQPSRWEAMSIAVLEAMSAARPIVATRVGENCHMLEDGVSALLVEPGNIDAMSEALACVVQDPALRRRLGAAAAGRVKEQFTVESMVGAYERIYLR